MNYWASDLFGFNGLENFFGDLSTAKKGPSVYSPAYEAGETENGFWLTLDMPGVSRDAIKIEVVDEHLVVTGERKDGERARQFQRSFHLAAPINVEKIEAEYKDGVLKVVLPKAESAKPRLIPIKEKVAALQ